MNLSDALAGVARIMYETVTPKQSRTHYVCPNECVMLNFKDTMPCPIGDCNARFCRTCQCEVHILKDPFE